MIKLHRNEDEREPFWVRATSIDSVWPLEEFKATGIAIGRSTYIVKETVNEVLNAMKNDELGIWSPEG